jgi:hypothetical protein
MADVQTMNLLETCFAAFPMHSFQSDECESVGHEVIQGPINDKFLFPYDYIFCHKYHKLSSSKVITISINKLKCFTDS